MVKIIRHVLLSITLLTISLIMAIVGISILALSYAFTFIVQCLFNAIKVVATLLITFFFLVCLLGDKVRKKKPKEINNG